MGVTVLGIQHNFYPRSPCGERLILHVPGVDFQTFLSTLSLRRATPAIAVSSGVWTFLSTLSLRRATAHVAAVARSHKISIHALLAESDRVCQGDKFRQSHFYPRSPCGERLSLMLYDTSSLIFLSTLSLRRATGRAESCRLSHGFLSTLSLRRATTWVLQS